jgi:hypothetical protein
MPTYDYSVFINCPFDDDYRSIFQALVFAVMDCGFEVRCAWELTDSSAIRVEEIKRLIGASRFGLHDLSRTEPDPQHGLPRFNMPLELGLFLGAKYFGSGRQQQKNALILDRERYRYQKFCSDLAGSDIQAHGGDPARAIGVVRDWLNAARPDTVVPGGQAMVGRYEQFSSDLPVLCDTRRIRPSELHVLDLRTLVYDWLDAHSWEA